MHTIYSAIYSAHIHIAYIRHIFATFFHLSLSLCSWFKEENEQLLPLQLSERITIVSAGLLKITKVCMKLSPSPPAVGPWQLSAWK